jgi:23S rRNA pseudouridine1911/1915/1917 synthase
MEIIVTSDDLDALGPDGAEVRLDRFLCSRPGGLSRGQSARLVREGHVRQNGRKPKPSATVRAGDRLVIDEEGLAAVTGPVPGGGDHPEAEQIPLSIIHRDDRLAVIDKPAGMSVHPGAGRPGGTLVNALLHHFPGLSGVGESGRPGIVHRLDKDTSGLILAALDPGTHRDLSRLFRTREIEKKYLALVWGVPDPPEGSIEAPIGRSPADRKKMSVLSGSGRPAVTRFRVLERVGSSFSLLSVQLLTGRTHQIRVHLRHIGHPVVGDPLYGGKRWKNIPHPGLRALLRSFSRQALHAHRLRFRHPGTDREVEFTSPLPADMAELIRKIDEMA